MPINFAVKLAATVAVEAVSVGLQASQRTKGPRLDELTVTTAEYGTPLPRFLGERVFACPVFHAEDLKEVKKTTKVKGGGKQTAYHYLATFACAIADNEIEKILKIWFDEKLVYDATGTGPISYASSLGVDLNSVMRIYLGTEDQMPDPRYTAWCEDRYGADSAPAYRGVSYLFFEELPVDNFGNRIPQIKVLAVSAADTAYPWQTVAKSGALGGEALSHDGARLYFVSNTDFQVMDVPSRTRIVKNTLSNGISSPWALTSDAIYGFGWGTDNFYRVGLDGGEATDVGTTIDRPGWTGCAYAGGLILAYPGSFTGNYVGVFSVDTLTSTATNHKPTHYFTNIEGAAVAVGTTSGNVLSIAVPATSATAILIDTSAYGSSGPAYGFDNGLGQYVVRQGAHRYLIDKTAFTITFHAVDVVNPPTQYEAFTATKPGTKTFWNGVVEYNSSDLSIIRTIHRLDWAVTLPSGCFETTGALYDPVNDALISIYNGSGDKQGLIWRYIDRASNGGTTLGAIVSKMCDAASLTDRDTSALTQSVAGYSWTRGDVKSQMEPVLDIHDIDARPHDFTIQFLPRGSAPAGTISTGEFAKNGDGARYNIKEKQDTDLPKLLRVNFADTGFDQQTNNVLSPLPADVVDSQRDNVIDLTTYADTPTGAQQKADRYMRREWNSRETIANSLTEQKLAMEPGDITTLSLDGIGQNARLTKQTLVGTRIDCEFVRDEIAFAAINSTTTGPTMDARDPETIMIPAPIRGFVIDAPLREDSDADVRPLLYAAAGSYPGLTYPGSVIYEATGAGSSLAYDQLFATLSSGATWGTCSDTLSDAASPWLWDRGNTLTVSLQSGSLTSVSESDVDADPSLNLLLVGRPGNWEYVNFTTATLNGDGSYTLSGFKRGRRGTEWACALHSAGEAFVLANALVAEVMGVGDVGASLSFKAQSIGRAVDATPAIDIAPFTGATLKPYAPARIDWTYDGTDLTGTIARRTRIGGAWTGGSAIPLSEASEAYEIDIYNGSTFKRTISVSGTNVFNYTSAMATADGITLPTPPSVNVYQMSDAVGRGYALAA